VRLKLRGPSLLQTSRMRRTLILPRKNSKVSLLEVGRLISSILKRATSSNLKKERLLRKQEPAEAGPRQKDALYVSQALIL